MNGKSDDWRSSLIEKLINRSTNELTKTDNTLNKIKWSRPLRSTAYIKHFKQTNLLSTLQELLPKNEQWWYPVLLCCLWHTVATIIKQNQDYCYSVKNWANEQLQDRKCKNKCPCHSWTKSCSHYKGKLPNLPNKTNKIISKHFPSNICSLKLSANCDETLHTGKF